MVKHLTGKLVLVASAAIVAGHQELSGQEYSYHTQPVDNHTQRVDNSSCAVGHCPTNFMTYGFFHENWRRWPEDTSVEQSSALNPFVVPDRDTPRPLIPSPRDEASQFLRKRTPIEATPEDARTDSSGPSTPSTPPSGGDSGFMGLEALPSDEPDTGNGPLDIPDLPNNDSIFGPSDDSAPGSSLPEESEEEFDLDSLDLSEEQSRSDHVTTTSDSIRGQQGNRTTSVQVEAPRQLPQIAARELGQEIHHVAASVDQVSASFEVGSVDRHRSRNPLRRNAPPSQRRSNVDARTSQANNAPASVAAVVQADVRPSRSKPGRSNPLRRR